MRLSQVVGAAGFGELEGDTLLVVSGGGSLEAALSRALSKEAGYVGPATRSGRGAASDGGSEETETEAEKEAEAASEGHEAALRILQSTFAAVPYALAQSCSGLR